MALSEEEIQMLNLSAEKVNELASANPITRRQLISKLVNQFKETLKDKARTIDETEERQAMLNSLEQKGKEVREHHLMPIVQESAAMMIAKREVNEVDLLSNNVAKLDTRLEQVFNELGNDLDPKMIDALTKLAREIRESLKYLMEFKGKLIHKRQDTIIVAQMQIVQEVLAQNNPEIWLDIKKKMQEKLQ